MIKVLEYVTSDGKAPLSEWLKKLNKKDRGRVRVRLNRIRLGNFGDCEPVGEGVQELRFFFGSGYRVYFGRKGDTIVILLSGGNKSSQKKDIKKARQYWRDYKNE